MTSRQISVKSKTRSLDCCQEGYEVLKEDKRLYADLQTCSGPTSSWVFGFRLGCHVEKKSTTGYIFKLAGGAVSWKSEKHKSIASSTMQAELVACFSV